MSWHKRRYKGLTKEALLIDLLAWFDIKFRDTRALPEFRAMDVDFVIGDYYVEVKSFSAYGGVVYFEEQRLVRGNWEVGWYYKTKAHMIVYIGYKGSWAYYVIVKNDANFKSYYENVVKDKAPLIRNDRSLIRKVPLSLIADYIVVIKRRF